MAIATKPIVKPKAADPVEPDPIDPVEPIEPDPADPAEPTEEEMTDGLDALAGEPIPWHGILAPVGKMTGDRRMFAEGGITNRELPLPFQWVKAASGAHDGQVVVANIEKIVYEGGLIKASGFFHNSAEAAELIELRVAGMMKGISVDLDATEIAFVNDNGTPYDFEQDVAIGDPGPVMLVTKGRIASATAVAIPAFQEAYFDLGTWEDAFASAAECQDCPEAEKIPDGEKDAVAASAFMLRAGDYCVYGQCGEEADVEVEISDEISAMYCFKHALLAQEAVASGTIETFAPGTKDGPGWITNPKATQRIRNYWVRGKGAAKIRWGQPGDFNRCRTQLAKYVKNPEWLAGLCANMHKEALGIWPGQHNSAQDMEAFMKTQTMAPAFSLVETQGDSLTASGAVTPAAWFENPQLVNITPMTITEDGRIFGHMATWRECHTGVQDRCVTAPHSQSGYAYFRTGARMTDTGEVAVGHITIDMGHADLSLSPASTLAHYDNTTKTVADIVTGEDSFGIWFAGALRSGIDEYRIETLRGAALSGDWRRINGSMELVATLAVNVPGFPVPRVEFAASGTRDMAMVAAGIVTRDPVDENVEYIADLVERAVNRIDERREQRDQRMSAMRRIAASACTEKRSSEELIAARARIKSAAQDDGEQD